MKRGHCTRMDAESKTASRFAGRALPHDSAHLHVTGQAAYTDDLVEPSGLLHIAVGMSAVAHARLLTVDLRAVREADGVVDVVTASDIRGENNYGPIVHDDPILAGGHVHCAGQPVFAVAARTVDQARKAAKLAHVEYEELEPVLDPLDAVEKGSFVVPSETMLRGDPDNAIAGAAHRLKGRTGVGGQDQFYLEGHVSMALPQEDGGMLVYSSTQHPDEVQTLVASATQRSAKDDVVICRRMGGAFGGKESQAALIALIAVLMSDKTGQPCKLRLDRDDDMLMTGKRHDFVIDYEVGFDDDGRIEGIEFMLASRCGMSADLSGPVNDRAMFHCDNAYFLENVRIVSHRCRTNTVSSTAFRGFGGPQGMFAIEHVIDEIARAIDKDPLDVRRVNFYGIDDRNVTHYQQTIEDNVIDVIVGELEATSGYRERRAEIRSFNAKGGVLRRGIALTPVKFGISFTSTILNQAGALVHVYKDGTVRLNHGGTEMGQGLYIKVAQVVADELCIDIDTIRSTAADTSKVPNASATAASSGSDMNGKAAQAAARKIKQRLRGVAARRFDVNEADVVFESGKVHAGSHTVSFTELVQLAWADRVSLSATGYYRTPKINYDRETLTGRPFFYYAYGAAVSEVVVDTLTGEHRILRVDILHDCGNSLNPAIDMGQVEGGFVQGAGWLTSEEICWNERGELTTHAPSTYKIPVCSDLALDFRAKLLENTRNAEETIYRSKAVGEPPFMLGISVFHAIRDAIATPDDPTPRLRAPATPESVLRAIDGVPA